MVSTNTGLTPSALGHLNAHIDIETHQAELATFVPEPAVPNLLLAQSAAFGQSFQTACTRPPGRCAVHRVGESPPALNLPRIPDRLPTPAPFPGPIHIPGQDECSQYCQTNKLTHVLISFILFPRGRLPIQARRLGGALFGRHFGQFIFFLQGIDGDIEPAVKHGHKRRNPTKKVKWQIRDGGHPQSGPPDRPRPSSTAPDWPLPWQLSSTARDRFLGCRPLSVYDWAYIFPVITMDMLLVAKNQVGADGGQDGRRYQGAAGFAPFSG